MIFSFRLRILAATTAHPLRTKAIRQVATAADTRLYLAECFCACATCKIEQYRKTLGQGHNLVQRSVAKKTVSPPFRISLDFIEETIKKILNT